MLNAGRVKTLLNPMKTKGAYFNLPIHRINLRCPKGAGFNALLWSINAAIAKLPIQQDDAIFPSRDSLLWAGGNTGGSTTMEAS